MIETLIFLWHYMLPNSFAFLFSPHTGCYAFIKLQEPGGKTTEWAGLSLLKDWALDILTHREHNFSQLFSTF